MAGEEFDPGSFRDRRSRVFRHAGSVFRALSREGLEDWEALSATAFFPRYVADGRVVRTERVESADGLTPDPAGSWAAVLGHEPIPFVSYPYEWPFGMLKDAALLHLDLLLAALDEGLTLKDASPYNVQWIGTRPIFIDVSSFQRLEPGEPWTGYRQFCELFLYPLFLQAYRDVPFQPWLRGSLDGIPAEHCARLLTGRDRLRPAVFLHAYLQARLQARYAAAAADVRADLRAAGFSKAAIEANVRRLAKTVRRLAWRRAGSEWADYATTSSYTAADRERKAAFVREAARARPRGLVWDLGCNTGLFSRVAAEHARYVVALDRDHLAVERLYQALRAEGRSSILPLVADVADLPAGLGWRGLERTSLARRGRPDLILCLALVHHLVIGASVPLEEVVEWLAGLGGDLVIEFVTREDPMVTALLRNRAERYDDYRIEHFERRLAAAFVVERREPLGSGTRFLYLGRARRA